MYLQLAIPLLFSVMFPATPVTIEPAEPRSESNIKTIEISSEVDLLCNCVAYAHSRVPNMPQINAIEMKQNIDIPVKGGIVIMKYGNIGHVAVIESVDYETMEIEITESNVPSCTLSYRTIPFNYHRIVGYAYYF